jgi:hypothetical protein
MKALLLSILCVVFIVSCSDTGTDTQTPEWHKLLGSYYVTCEEDYVDEAKNIHTKRDVTFTMTIKLVSGNTVQFNYQSEMIKGIISRGNTKWEIIQTIPPATTYALTFNSFDENKWSGVYSKTIVKSLNDGNIIYVGGKITGQRLK